MEVSRTEAPAFEGSGAETLDEYVGPGGQALEQVLAGGVGHVQSDGLLVARMDLPPQRNAVVERAPVAQGVAGSGTLDLDDLGSEVGHQRGSGSAGDDDGQVQDAEAGEGSR